MAKNKKTVVKNNFKKDISNKVHTHLTNALSTYQEQLGEKTLEKKIKKLTKLIVKRSKKGSDVELENGVAPNNSGSATGEVTNA